MRALTFAVVSLGCPKNEADLEQAASRLIAAGHRQVRDPRAADLMVVNTCAFTAEAEQESRAALREVCPPRARGRLTVAMGCLAQRLGKQVRREYPHVNVVLGTGAYPRIAAAVARALAGATPVLTGAPACLPATPATVKLTPGHYAYLRVAEGCDHRCRYCLIPELRGPYRSRPVAALVAEAKRRLREGATELILVAQDTTRYGTDLRPRTSLAELVRKLAPLPGLAWLRLLYAHPDHLTDELLAVIRDTPTVAKYLDLPLQHSHPRILAAMGRPVLDHRALVARVRAAIPGLTLRTTLMTGYPGEGNAEFADLCDFVETMRFERLGLFAYSPRTGTPAFALGDQLDPDAKEERRQLLWQLQAEGVAERNRARLGTTVPVMVDGREGGWLVGRTAGDAPEIDQTVRWRGRARLGALVPVRLTAVEEFGFRARPVGTKKKSTA